MTGGITEIPGMIIEGTGAGGQVKFLNTANGATVLTFNSGSMVQGEVTVSNGVVYLPQANGNLMAAGLGLYGRGADHEHQALLGTPSHGFGMDARVAGSGCMTTPVGFG